ncbi:hypothetical protein N7510_000873 [Penicillium lagena]|uniref:uncharacterized protein n=1 Tax=Penicillium lagena TaxID=94218 RepID=UPI0025416ACF|nr:uncharacterized protein N7510_000873 [Penicillium lagena]KAJ5624564.1 hypothetical protein N7510_000873 [Penicillium lagena]
MAAANATPPFHAGRDSAAEFAGLRLCLQQRGLRDYIIPNSPDHNASSGKEQLTMMGVIMIFVVRPMRKIVCTFWYHCNAETNMYVDE